jgi:2-iminobutanoate/2-iminopropanoate deaminase
MPRTVSTDRAPRAIEPYSQAVIHGDLVFLSGQIALDAATGQLVDGDIAAQTRRVLDNIQAVLEAAGSSLGSVLRTTVFLKDMSEFAAMNAVYGEYFPDNPPARSTVQAARLPRDVSIEIDVIAALER